MSPVQGRWPGASRRTADTPCDVAKPRGYRRTPGTPLRRDSLPPAFGGHTHPEAGPAEKVGNEIQPVLRGCGERLRPTLKGHGGPAARVTSTVTVSAVSLRAARRERAGGRACSRLMVCVRVRTPGRRGGVRGKCRRTGRQPGRFAAVPWTAYARGEPAWR